MSTGIQLTAETLAKSRNSAATDALLSALESDNHDCLGSVLHGLVTRRSKVGHTAVLSIWHTLDNDQRDIVKEGRGRMGGALRDALLSEDHLFENACEVAEFFQEYDLASTLITIAEHPTNPRAKRAMQLTRHLISQLNHMLHSPRDADDRRDPELLRRNVLECLKRSLSRFRQHKREELVEAFVTLAGATNGPLNSILDDPRHVCFQTVVNSLSYSRSSGVVHLIFEFMKLDTAHVVVRNVVSKRSDAPFLAALCSFVEKTNCSNVRKNLHRITSFKWLEPLDTLAERFSSNEITRIAPIVASSGLPEPDALQLIKTIFSQGDAQSRLVVCKMLEQFQSQGAATLIVAALDDQDPHVQACAIYLTKDRDLPGLLDKLMVLLESPHAVTQEAARAVMTEFSFESYLSRYDMLDELVRRSTGELVCKVDPEATSKLCEQMQSPSRKQRMRAIQMSESLRVLNEVSDSLMELLEDEDHLIRAASVEALQYCTGNTVRQALMDALSDKSSAVQAAARSSLAYQGVALEPVASGQGGGS